MEVDQSDTGNIEEPNSHQIQVKLTCNIRKFHCELFHSFAIVLTMRF